MSWIANALIIWAWWAMGSKGYQRDGLLAGTIGSLLWFTVAVDMGRLDLITINAFLTLLGFRAWQLCDPNGEPIEEK